MPTDLTSILEQQLRSVHMPDAVSWWPLAIGWWILIGLTALLLTYLVARIIKKKQKNRYRETAIRELSESLNEWRANNDDSHYLFNANMILKRIMRRFDANSSNQTGLQWANSLNSMVNKPLSDSAVNALTEQCYRQEPTVDIQHVHKQVEQWITRHTEACHA